MRRKLIKQVFSESEKGEKEKVLIFTEYRKTQDHLVEELEKTLGKGRVVINGDMKFDQRKTSVNRFRDDDNVRFMVSTESGGEGINLQFCHVLVNYDLPWNPMRIEQRVGRIYRFGQTKGFKYTISAVRKQSRIKFTASWNRRSRSLQKP